MYRLAVAGAGGTTWAITFAVLWSEVGQTNAKLKCAKLV